MWIVFAILSMVLYAMGEMTGNKVVRKNVVSGPFLVYFAASFFGFLSAIFLWLTGMGESGATPVRILTEHPLIALSTVSTFLATLLVFVAFRYIGLSIEAAVSGASAIVLFLGMVGINIITGKMESVREILVPGRLIPILIVIALIFCLSKTDKDAVNKALKGKKKLSAMVTGILILLVACIFDASDSLIVAYCFENEQVGSIDYYIATSFMDIVFGIGCLATVIVQNRKNHSSRKNGTKGIPAMIFIGVFSIGSMLTYLIGSGYDAVKFAMLYIAYPIVPLIGARLFLKERYTVKQYFCIIGIAIASIVFCIMDYV